MTALTSPYGPNTQLAVKSLDAQKRTALADTTHRTCPLAQIDKPRRRLAVQGKAVGFKFLSEVTAIVTPDTTMAWHRKLTVMKWEFCEAFRAIQESAGTTPLRLPPRSPNLHAYAGWVVRSMKEECLPRITFFGKAAPRSGRVQCRDRLGGMLRHYHRQAA